MNVAKSAEYLRGFGPEAIFIRVLIEQSWKNGQNCDIL